MIGLGNLAEPRSSVFQDLSREMEAMRSLAEAASFPSSKWLILEDKGNSWYCLILNGYLFYLFCLFICFLSFFLSFFLRFTTHPNIDEQKRPQIEQNTMKDRFLYNIHGIGPKLPANFPWFPTRHPSLRWTRPCDPARSERDARHLGEPQRGLLRAVALHTIHCPDVAMEIGPLMPFELMIFSHKTWWFGCLC